jgi:hypothetical protein
MLHYVDQKEKIKEKLKKSTVKEKLKKSTAKNVSGH